MLWVDGAHCLFNCIDDVQFGDTSYARFGVAFGSRKSLAGFNSEIY